MASFKAGEETELPESVIKALGNRVKVLDEVQPGASQESNPAPQETQKEQKDVPQPPVDGPVSRKLL